MAICSTEFFSAASAFASGSKRIYVCNKSDGVVSYGSDLWHNRSSFGAKGNNSQNRVHGLVKFNRAFTVSLCVHSYIHLLAGWFFVASQIKKLHPQH